MNTPRRILLIESEDDIAEMLRLLFAKHGYTVQHTTDGAAALEALRGQFPHLILMDIALRDGDGFAIVSYLREKPRTRHIPIIIVTRDNTRESRQQAWEMGVYDYIAKPFDAQELLLRVQNSIASAEQVNLVDPPSGLPGAFVARDYLTTARRDPALAVIEVRLENSAPYFDTYGAEALDRVRGYLGELIVWVLGQGSPSQSFAGYLDEEELIIVYPAAEALTFAERVTAIFNFRVRRHYNELDQERGYLAIDAQRFPLMQICCRVHSGDQQYDIPAPASDDEAAAPSPGAATAGR